MFMASNQMVFCKAIATVSSTSEEVTVPIKGCLDFVTPILLLVTMGWRFTRLLGIGEGMAKGQAYLVDELEVEVADRDETLVGRAYRVLEDGVLEGELDTEAL